MQIDKIIKEKTEMRITSLVEYPAVLSFDSSASSSSTSSSSPSSKVGFEVGFRDGDTVVEPGEGNGVGNAAGRSGLGVIFVGPGEGTPATTPLVGF
jgi:hypothetical protein